MTTTKWLNNHFFKVDSQRIDGDAIIGHTIFAAEERDVNTFRGASASNLSTNWLEPGETAIFSVEVIFDENLPRDGTIMERPQFSIDELSDIPSSNLRYVAIENS